MISLICIYMLIFVTGILGVAVMIKVLKSNLRSVTTVSVLNLIMAHIIFLPTIPFRIDYYVRESWDLPPWVCQLVSGLIHIHMYLSFIIYVVMLILRFYIFHKHTESPEFHRKLHAFGASAAVWAVVFIVGPPVLFRMYGNNNEENMLKKTCFNFGSRMEETSVRVMNYIISCVFITVPIVLCAVQAHILLTVTRHYGASSTQQQEFWAQMKNLNFVLVMLVCFVPYHIFRIHYVSHIAHNSHSNIEAQNEIFLAITGLSCIDLLMLGCRVCCRSCGRASYFF